MQDYANSPLGFPIRTRWTGKPPVPAQIDWRHPHAQELEVCWLFNEAQGPIIHDLTGHGHDVTVGLGSGDTMWTQWVTMEMEGRPGPALQGLREPSQGMGGVNAVVGNLALPIQFAAAQSWTVEIWLYDTGIIPVDATFGYVFYPRSLAPLVQLYHSPGSIVSLFDTFQSVNVQTTIGRWTHAVFSKHAQSSTSNQMRSFRNGEVQTKVLSENIQVVWNRFLKMHLSEPTFTGIIGLTRLWNRSMDVAEALDLYQHPFAMFAKRRAFYRNQRNPFPPARMAWQAQGLLIPRIIRAAVPPPAIAWSPQAIRASGVLNNTVPARMAWQPGLFHRTMTISPIMLRWVTERQRLPVGLNIRDCGPEYEAALQRTTIGGDWLISAPAIGLFLSCNYEAGNSYEHRIIDISDIEISAPPGGGMASGANVTISVAETGSGQSMIALWEAASAVGAVSVTIDFLLAGADQVLRIYTGSIDNIMVKDGIAQILLVDASIHHNLVLPRELVTVEKFPQADQGALTRPIPLVYGEGSHIGASPLLLVDVPNNIYLLAAHPMLVGGRLAVYDDPTKSFLTLDTIVVIPNHGNATITLGTLTTGDLRLWDYLPGTVNPGAAIDGNSLTVTTVPTTLTGPGYSSATGVVAGDGWGYARWGPSNPGQPRAGTMKIDIMNHRRSPGSDPTVTGTFVFRTVDGSFPCSIERRMLYVSPAFNHVTSAQNNTFILSNVNIGVNEIFDVLLITRCQGQISGVNQTYEVGEVSVTPLVAFSANTSGTMTAVGIPINVQELRFNAVRPPLSYYTASFVANATFAIDGNSTTTAAVRTIGLDSNLDGYGQLVVATDVTSALRANNTVVIDLLNHRRGEGSSPTVTGTFSIQTLNTNTGVVLRENLFVTQAFRHQTNPISTSYVATAINLGATAQLAVRLVARNEGGSGAAADWYEVGEIGIESFYQPRGDSGEVFLLGEGYEGRTDVDGTVTDYIGASPGRLFQTPDQVIASFFVQELGLELDDSAFATAYNFYSANGLRFDGGIGAGWAVGQGQARNLLGDLARQATAILFPTFEETWGIRPFRTDTAIHQAFTSASILTEMGSEQQRPEDRTSTVQITLGNLQNVYNHFEVRFKYNVGSEKYDGVWKVDKDGSNLPEGTLDKAEIEATCYQSWLRYGDLTPLIMEANWISEDVTAAYLLRHLAFYFSQQRLTVQFETTFQAACCQVGDFITITDASLPEGDNGGTFEIHTLRYMPFKGRIQIVASRVSSIPDVPIPPAPPALVGCERFGDSPGMLACWDFEEASGNRVDHLFETALTPVNNPLGVTGKIGNAVEIVRVTGQYLTNDQAMVGAFTGNFTVACWVRLRSLPTDWYTFISNQDPTTGYPKREIFLGAAAGGTILFAVGDGNLGGLVYSTAALPYTGTSADWTLVRAWRSIDASGNGMVYIQLNNGTIETANFTGYTTAYSYNGFHVGAWIGPFGGRAGFADIILDQLMIWRRVLTQAEHDAIWNGGAG